MAVMWQSKPTSVYGDGEHAVVFAKRIRRELKRKRDFGYKFNLVRILKIGIDVICESPFFWLFSFTKRKTALIYKTKHKENTMSNNNRSALIGAAFLMATSAIGPGFLTQTATF